MITFADLFSGIGGFHIALSSLGCKCVFAAEIDANARKTYRQNFMTSGLDLENNFAQDITTVDIKSIPQFDILCAGFPCQPFSQAGKKKGFTEARGTLFFNIAEIIKEKQPKSFFLENVRHLLNHDAGNTFECIRRIITKDLGYSFYYKIIKASDFGLPQHRPRLFMVGFREPCDFQFPEPLPLNKTMSDIFNAECDKDIGYTLRVGGRSSGLYDRRNWDTYLVEGKARRLTPREGLKMQGFPENFIFPVSETQAMKQLGNSVAVPVIAEVAKQVIKSVNAQHFPSISHCASAQTSAAHHHRIA